MLNSIITRPVTMPGFLICLAAAMVLGVLLAMVFSYKSRHSSGFALTLALIPLTVTVIIMLVNGNIGAGIAVAGAFTLVRFRSVPGTATEIAAIFTSMAVGLALGMGYVGIAVLFFVCVAVFTLLLTALHFGGVSKAEKQLKITIPENYNYEGLFDDIFAAHTICTKLERIRTTNMGTLIELTYHVIFRDGTIRKEFLDEIRTRNGNLTIMIGEFSDREIL